MSENKDKRKVVIELDNVKRYFHVGSEIVIALRGVSFKIYEGEFVTIQGTSGSGKSTLLNQLGCLDTPTSGEYYLDGTPVRKMSKNQRAKLRNRKIGIKMLRYLLSAFCPSIAFLNQRIKTRRTHLDNRKLRSNEKAVQRHQK